MGKVVVVACLLAAGTAAADGQGPIASSTAAADGRITEAPRTVDARRGYLRLDLGLGAPTGYYGVSFGYAVHPDITIEAGVGRGSTGLQLALLARHYRIVRSPDNYFTAAIGPSLSLLSKTLGGDIPSRPDKPEPDGTFYLTGVNAEIGHEIRSTWGGVYRITLGAFVRIKQDMTAICDGAPQGGQCNPEPVDNSFDMHAAKVASWRWFPYVGLGFGYAF
jgi:hypothetical protein